MKKLHILIPSLIATASMPLIGLVGCREKEPEPPEPEPEPVPEPVPEGNCLTITALQDSRIYGERDEFGKSPTDFCPDFHYAINDNPGYKYDFPSEDEARGKSLQLKAGDTIKLWGNNPDGFSCRFEDENSSYVINKIVIKGKADISGNIMSLIDDGLCQEDTIPCPGCFQRIFFEDNIVNAENLILPTKLTDYCFTNMFYGCEKLITAPKLDAQELAPKCYMYMFNSCSSLTTVSNLPATSLEEYCYRSMFSNCTSLVVPPVISAKTLADTCCFDMFGGCSQMCISTNGENDHKFFTCPEIGEIKDPVFQMFSGTQGGISTPKEKQSYYWVDLS